MSLAERFEVYAKQDADEGYTTMEAMMRAAFYAGAEAAMAECWNQDMDFPDIARAEIDAFKGKK